jgi:hypothetical protein
VRTTVLSRAIRERARSMSRRYATYADAESAISASPIARRGAMVHLFRCTAIAMHRHRGTGVHDGLVAASMSRASCANAPRLKSRCRGERRRR